MLNIEQASKVVYTDRSRTEEYQRCARKRYWSYHYQLPGMLNGGLAPNKPALELTVGSAVHKGVECLLNECMAAVSVDLAAATAQGLAEFDAAWESWLSFNDLTDPSQLLSYQLTEARALIEALIAAFYYADTGLKLLTENYNILAVEQEIQVPLADWLVLNSRPDAILQHKRTGQYFPWSLKTAKKWDDRTNAQAEVDNQGISESISTEYWLNHPAQMGATGHSTEPIICSGVLMCYLIKGEKRKDPTDDIYRTASPLIRPFFNTQSFDYSDFSNYAPTNKWTCTEEHEHKGARFSYKVNGVNGCPGGKNHMRGDAWQQVNLWEQGVSISDWISHLADEQPEVLMGFVQVPAPYKRDRSELESWSRQVTAQEEVIKHGLELLNGKLYLGDNSQSPIEILDSNFPQSRTNCVYPWKCTHYDICHKGGQERLLDPSLFTTNDLTAGLVVLEESGYAERSLNHIEGVIDDGTN